MSDVIDMSFEAQYARLHAAAKEMGKFTINELLTKSKARRAATIRYCMRHAKEVGAVKSFGSRTVTVYQQKEML